MRDLVFISPVTPSSAGPGLAMRADRVLRSLARRYRVHLRVVPLQELRPATQGPRYAGPVETQARVWVRPSLGRRLRYRRDHERARLSPGLVRALRESLPASAIDTLLVFRHGLLPVVQAVLCDMPRPRVVLDLDELESTSRGSLARLHAARGEEGAAAALRTQSERYRRAEAQGFAGVDQIWLASALECQHLAEVCSRRAWIVPNVVSADVSASSPRPAARAEGTLLFVGSLGYLPNADAAEWFCRDILTRISVGVHAPIRFRMVGAIDAQLRGKLGEHPGVEVAGRVDDLGAEYARADLSVVPLRAGGGTRIKVLEALAHGCPVVSTPLGAEGLDLVDGEEVLLAEDAADFARACASLLSDPQRAAALAARGADRVARDYGSQALDRAIDAALEQGTGAAPS